MYFDPTNEFPHSIELLVEKSVSNGMGGTKKEWTTTDSITGFMDTPRTDRRLEAHQMGITLDRDLYVPYGTLLPANARYAFEGDTFLAAGKAENQGGMNEVMRLPLKLV